MNYNPNYNNYNNYNPQPQKQPAFPQVVALANSAFSKGLAAAIMCSFPIASIVAIILGFSAKSTSAQASALAAQYNCEFPGKGVAGKILGLIGGIAGIVMTVVWFFYIILIVAVVSEF
ncbi:MAG: hypothetical protein IJC49_00450 [Clostridia bacterium]|nr:hypothetical protein [Clostridia bacterium]